MSVNLDEIGPSKLEAIMQIMRRNGCYHLKLSDAEIDLSQDNENHGCACDRCDPKQDEPPPTQRSGQNLFSAEVCPKCARVGQAACTCKQEEPDKPAFRGPIEIQTGPDGEPVAIIDPDLLGLGKE